MTISTTALDNCKQVWEAFRQTNSAQAAVLAAYFSRPGVADWVATIGFAFGEEKIEHFSTAPTQRATNSEPDRLGAIGISGTRVVVATCDLRNPEAPVPEVAAYDIRAVESIAVRVQDDINARAEVDGEDARANYAPQGAGCTLKFRDGRTVAVDAQHPGPTLDFVLAVVARLPRAG